MPQRVTAGQGFGNFDTRWVLAALAALATFAAALAPGIASAAPATLSVETTGVDAGDCTTSACATVQYAVDQAGSGDTIVVGAGTYVENVKVQKEVTLRGANAGVAGSAARGPETTIAATAGKTLEIKGPGVTVEGLAITNVATYAIYAAQTSGLRLDDNIVVSGQRALTFTLGTERAQVEGNLIEGDIYGLAFSGLGTYEDVRVADNYIAITSSENYALFNGGEGATFPGLEIVDNQVRGSGNIGGNVEGGLVSGNSFEVGAEELALQIDLHGSTVSDNSFEGNGEGSCLQIFGSQYGLDPSSDATVAGNHFHGCAPFAIQLSPDIEAVTISGNTITDSYDGINTRLVQGETPWSLDGHAIRVVGNRIVDSAHLGIANSVAGTLEASDNWWGCNAGPALAAGNGCDAVSPGVQAAPWLVLTSTAPASVAKDAGAAITAAIDTDSAGAHVAAVPDGTPVAFSSDRGTLSATDGGTVGGATSTTLTSATDGTATVGATVDHQRVDLKVEIAKPADNPAPPAEVAPPAPPAAPAPVAPRVQVVETPAGAPLRLSSSGSVEVASVDCPQGSCLIAIKQRKIMIGGRGFPLQLKFDRLIGEGGSTAVIAVLPGSARRALGGRDQGQAIIRLRVFSGTGVQEIPIRVRVAAPKPKG